MFNDGHYRLVHTMDRIKMDRQMDRQNRIRAEGNSKCILHKQHVPNYIFLGDNNDDDNTFNVIVNNINIVS